MSSPVLQFHPVLGIIGGAGPLIAARFHYELLARFQVLTDAQADASYPSLVVINQALAGVDETGVSNPIQASAALEDRLRAARAAGATRWLLTCVSLHALPAAQAPGGLDWLTHAATALHARGLRRIGVVGSASSHRDGVLAEACVAAGLVPVVLDATCQRLADELIHQGMTGRLRSTDREAVAAIEAYLAPQCDLIWWGCTELSFIPPDWFTCPHLQSLDAMVAAALDAPL